jgi:hypothetical protein
MRVFHGENASFSSVHLFASGPRGRWFKSSRPDLKKSGYSRSIVRSCFSLMDNGLRWKSQEKLQFNSTSKTNNIPVGVHRNLIFAKQLPSSNPVATLAVSIDTVPGFSPARCDHSILPCSLDGVVGRLCEERSRSSQELCGSGTTGWSKEDHILGWTRRRFRSQTLNALTEPP